MKFDDWWKKWSKIIWYEKKTDKRNMFITNSLKFDTIHFYKFYYLMK